MTSVEDHDKENTSTIEEVVIIDDDDASTKKKETMKDTFFSPPKKKFKQDALPFAKLSKNEETLKKVAEKSPKSNTEKDTTISPKPSDVIKSERQLQALSKNRKSPNNVPSKNNEPVKNCQVVSPKIVQSPKTVLPGKKVQTPKNTPTANKPKEKKPDGVLIFPKISKEDALKESEKEVQQLTKLVEIVKEDASGTNGEENEIMVNGIEICEPNEENDGTPISKKTPQSAEKKTSPNSKERQRIKEEKEMSKAARLKEIEEKRKKKEEEKILRQAEKEKRENEKKEKERLREEEKKTREEEKRKKDELIKVEKEKREKKEQERKMEKEKRDAEKEKREVERKVKEEQKKQEEEKKKLEDEAIKKKKEKEANHFRSFFTKKKAKRTKAPVVETSQRFKPFQVKPDMVLAPLVRRNKINRDLLDETLENEIPEINTYLKEQAINLANNKKTIYTSRRKARRDIEELRKLEVEKNKETLRNSTRNQNSNIIEEVVVIDDDSNDNELDSENEDNEPDSSVCDKYIYTSKLLQFSENTRPSYYGTWRKKSSRISGRRPFTMDNDVFNYEVDSDEEWIDEPGENLSDAADDDEEEEKETEDDQDGFFVPHGYLSDDEGIEDDLDDDDNTEEEGEKIPIQTVEKREEDKLKLKVCTFEQAFQKKIKHRKPICIGITYSCNIEGVKAILNEYAKIALFKPTGDDKEEEDEEHASPSNSAKKSPSGGQVTPANNNVPMTVPEEAMPLLIRFIYGNVKSLPHMTQTFRDYWSSYTKENGLSVRAHISKRQIEKKIQAIATRIYNKELGKNCYVVNDDVLKEYDLIDLKIGEGLPLLKSENNISKLPDSSEPMEVKNSILLNSPEPMEVKNLVLLDSTDEPIDDKNIERKNQPLAVQHSKVCIDTPMEVNS